MRLIARQPCSFGGKKFYIGDEVPPELVLDAKAQEKKGVLTISEDKETVVIPEPAITVNVHAKEGDMPVELTSEGLQAVFDVLNSTAEEAPAIIEEMTDGDALILLHVTDKRKSVKDAAEARAKELNEGER